MRLQEVVDEVGDLFERQFGSGMRVEHRRMIDVLLRPVTTASTVSACTLMLVCISAARCGGSAPTRVGWMPFLSTRQGTSTQAPSGRLSIRPWFATLPYITRGWPVSWQG